MYQGPLDRESLRGGDGVKHLKNTWRPRFIKGALSVFLWRFFLYSRKERKMEMVKWTGKKSSFLKRSKDSWMDMLPTNNMSETRR